MECSKDSNESSFGTRGCDEDAIYVEGLLVPNSSDDGYLLHGVHCFVICSI